MRPAAGQTRGVTQPPRQRKPMPTSPFRREEVLAPSTDGFAVGDRVTHDKCGLGRVVAVSEKYVTVDFGSAGTRRVAAGARGFAIL